MAGGDLDAPAEYMPGAMVAERLDADGDDLLADHLDADAPQAISRLAQRLDLMTQRPTTFAEADVVPVEAVEAKTGPVAYRDVLEFCADTDTDDPHETVAVAEAAAEAKRPPRDAKAERALRDQTGILPTTAYALADVAATGAEWAQRAVDALHGVNLTNSVTGARRDATKVSFTARELLAAGATPADVGALPRPTHESRTASARMVAVQKNLDTGATRREAALAEAAEAAAALELPEFVNLAEHVPADEPWLVEGLWGAGAVFGLFAERKVGKSTTVREIVRPILNGGSVFGHFPVRVEPGTDVVLIDSEMPLDYLHELYTGAGVGNLDRLRLASIRGVERTFDVRVPEVRTRWAERIAPGSIIIFDCLYALLAALGLSENDDAVAEVLVGLRELMTEADAAGLMIVHHKGKDAGRGARGHGAIEGMPDVLSYLELDGQLAGDTARKFRAYGRGVDVPTGTLTYAADRLTFESKAGAKAARTLSREQAADEAVLAVIIDKPGLSGAAVIDALPLGTDGKKIVAAKAARASIDRLDAAHRIVNKGRDRAPEWHLNTAPGDPFAAPPGGQK